MKKIMAIGLVLVLCVVFSACGKEDANSSKETSSPLADSMEPVVESTAGDDTRSNAVALCQFVKDCLGEPDSFQIHGLSHLEDDGYHYYYLDFSHMVKNEEMVRTYYFAEFDGAALLCIVNENSSIYYQTDGDYTTKYPVLSAMFQEQSADPLDVESIASDLS